MKKNEPYKNCIILLIGFAGTGKLTVAKELIKHPNFKLVDNHLWNNVVFGLINQDGLTPLPETVWKKAGKICDVVFETMRELSPHDFSFVITQEMIEGDEYPKHFYALVNQLVKDRNSIFLPVRLICDAQELVKRVKITERRNLYKTIDADRATRLSQHHEVFHTKHPNEITINNTEKSPDEVTIIILNHLNKIITV